MTDTLKQLKQEFEQEKQLAKNYIDEGLIVLARMKLKSCKDIRTKINKDIKEMNEVPTLERLEGALERQKTCAMEYTNDGLFVLARSAINGAELIQKEIDEYIEQQINQRRPPR